MKYILLIILLIEIGSINVEADNYSLSAGTKAYYSENSYDSNTYYLPFLSAGYSGSKSEIKGGYSALLGYPLLTLDDSFKDSDLNKYSLSLNIFPLKFLEFNFRGDYYSGDYNYERYEYTGEVFYEFLDFSISVGGKISSSSYEIEYEKIELNTNSYFIEFVYNLNNSISFDVTYTYSILKSDQFMYDNFTNTFRGGLLVGFVNHLYILTGASYGNDNDNFTIYGADIGINFYILKHVKFNLIYIYSYNDNKELTGLDSSYSLHNLSTGITFYM